MAAPWIKWSKGLTQKREVLLLSAELGINVYEIAGRLMRFWEWLDDNVTTREVDDDGNARVTLGALPLALVNSVSGVTGFGEALASVGWLKVDGRDLIIVNFSRHNGETAKTRAQTAVRVAKHKTTKVQGNATANGVGNAQVTVTALPRVEEIREEYLGNKKEPAGADRITDGASLPDSAITIRYEPDPAEAQRREDDAIAKAIDIVAAWPMPTAINDDIGRKLVANWVAARYLAGHGWMTAITWHSSVGGFHSMNREWWASNLRSSAAGGWKNLGKKDPGTNRGTVARRRDIPDTPDDPEAYRIAAERAREATRREATANGITQG